LAQTDDDGRVFFASRRWRKPMAMGGFFRIAPLAQSDDDGRYGGNKNSGVPCTPLFAILM